MNFFSNLKEESAFRFIYVPASESNSEIDGVNLLNKAYSIHKDFSDIVKPICFVFKELCNYG